MSIIFGKKAVAGTFVDESQLFDLAEATDRYALDGTFVRAQGGIGMGFQPYHTHERSALESRPAVDASGNIATFDGRLDNHRDLGALLAVGGADVADSVIVLAAFRTWGEACFQRLIGDWALALWSQSDRLLYLARDHAGTRTLYFEEKNGRLLWSTYLETFLDEGRPQALDEDYVASYLTCRPVHNRTPYKGIVGVRPAHYSVFGESRVAEKSQWEPEARERTRYRTDQQYEEHFLGLFRQAVERRTGPGAPALAHLSGGVDSTSIVCICDEMRKAQSATPLKLISTLSFYDDSEPSWNEKPYFSLVEAQRRQEGIHIESSFADWTFDAASPHDHPYLFPGADSGSLGRERRVRDLLRFGGYRAIVAGTGGDEVLGGIPTPLPTLADDLVSMNVSRLLRTAVEWCLAGKKPLTTMLYEVAAFAIDMYRAHDDDLAVSCPWVKLRQNPRRAAGRRWNSSRQFRPSDVSNNRTWWRTTATLPHLFPAALHRYEYRYPYLDRDLVEFLFSIPPEQLVRPGQRRSLMRRALNGIVPAEILDRRRKAYLARGPFLLLQRAEDRIRGLFRDSLVEQCGFVDSAKFISAFTSVLRGDDRTSRSAIMRTIGLELWLQSSFNRIAPGIVH